jgi:hypothetical protein
MANTEVAPTVLNKIERYLISKGELEIREANGESEELQYFNILNSLTEKDCSLISGLNDLVTTNRRFKRHSSKIDAIVKRISDESILIPLSLLKEIKEVINDVIKHKLSIQGKGYKNINLDFMRLSSDVFQRRYLLIETLELKASDQMGHELDIYHRKMKELKDLIDKFDIYPGLSIRDFRKIQNILFVDLKIELEA